jgi:hypothetical protein
VPAATSAAEFALRMRIATSDATARPDAEGPPTSAAGGGSTAWGAGAAASGGGSAAASGSGTLRVRDDGVATLLTLRGTLLRALGVLRWLSVYRYYGRGDDGLAPRARFAVAQLEACTDALYDACNFGGAPRAAELHAADAQRSWLVCCLHYLSTHLPAGPPMA